MAPWYPLVPVVHDVFTGLVESGKRQIAFSGEAYGSGQGFGLSGGSVLEWLLLSPHRCGFSRTPCWITFTLEPGCVDVIQASRKAHTSLFKAVTCIFCWATLAYPVVALCVRVPPSTEMSRFHASIFSENSAALPNTLIHEFSKTMDGLFRVTKRENNTRKSHTSVYDWASYTRFVQLPCKFDLTAFHNMPHKTQYLVIRKGTECCSVFRLLDETHSLRD